MERGPDVRARIPAEWEPTQAIWIGASVDRPAFMDFTAALARTLLPHVPVKVLVATDDAVAKARDGLRERNVAVDAISFLAHPGASYFVRDSALFMRGQDGRPGVVELGWNSYGFVDWCENYLYPDQPERARRYTDLAARDDGGLGRWIAAQVGGVSVPADIVMEAGGIEVNGDGVLLVSEPLALQRNRGRDRPDLERALLALPGIRKVIWLAEGLAEDPQIKGTITGNYVAFGTGGHADEFVRFADRHTILLAWVDDSDVDAHPLNGINRARMQLNYDVLAGSTDERGRPFRIVKVPLPAAVERQEVLEESGGGDELSFTEASFPARERRRTGDRVTRVASASYLNYLVVNDQLVLPTYVEDGTSPAVEQRVRDIFAEVFPGRAQHLVRATDVNWGGGGIHCATNSEPCSTAEPG